MMDCNFSLITMPDVEAGSSGTYNGTDLPSVVIFLTTIMALSLSLLGFVGNGIVIWLLGFCIKRNSFTNYILNLSIADFGVVTAVFTINIFWLANLLDYVDYFYPLKTFFDTLFLFMFSTSQFLLSLISIDRCVCVYFPLWHRCHRPPHLSIILCAIIWVLIFLFSVSGTVLLTTEYINLWYYQLFLNALICTPVMTISTIALLIKICIISPQYKRRKFLTAILLTLLLFLFFAFPMNTAPYLSNYVPHLANPYFTEYALLGAYINSIVNPLIYFLIGREKRGGSRKRLKKILVKLFKEDEDSPEEMESSVQTHL